MIPVYCETYSSLAGDFKSENAQLLKLIDTLFRHVWDRRTHAHDRGGDRGVIYKKYLGKEKAQRLVIRLRGKDLMHQGKRRNCWGSAKVVPTFYETVLVVYEEEKERRGRFTTMPLG